MNTPFDNDPFAAVAAAFEKLYNMDYVAYWDENLNGECCPVYGMTKWPGDNTLPPVIHITTKLPVADAVKSFAHELAHVAMGPEAQHGKRWKQAFTEIQREYNKIMGAQKNE